MIAGLIRLIAGSVASNVGFGVRQLQIMSVENHARLQVCRFSIAGRYTYPDLIYRREAVAGGTITDCSNHRKKATVQVRTGHRGVATVQIRTGHQARTDNKVRTTRRGQVLLFALQF